MDEARILLLLLGLSVLSSTIKAVPVYPSSTCFNDYIYEGKSLTCECKSNTTLATTGTPPIFSWPGHSSSAILNLNSVTRQMNGTRYNCSVQGVDGEPTRTATYFLQVAYGPSDQDTAITSPSATPIIDGKTRKVTLTCAVSNTHPKPGFSWTFVTCDKPNSETCTFTPTAKDDGKMVVCSATNPVLPANNKVVFSTASYTLNFTYPPTSMPEIRSTTSIGEVLRSGDTVTCTVSGGKPLVSGVTFSCLNPSLPDRYDVIFPTSLTSSVIVETSSATADKMTCTCSAIWGPEPGLYSNVTTAPYLLEYKPTISAFTLNATSDLTVSENRHVTVHFQCDVIARSSADVIVHKQGNVTALGVTREVIEDGSDVIRRKVHTYQMTSARCEDMGTYTCNANSGFMVPSIVSVRLNVNCAPRPHNSSFNPPPALTSQPLTLFLVANPAPEYFQVSPMHVSPSPNSDEYKSIFKIECKTDVWLRHLAVCSVARGDKGGDSAYYGMYNVTASNTQGEFTFRVELGKPDASPFLGLSASSAALMVSLIAVAVAAVVVIVILVAVHRRRKRGGNLPQEPQEGAVECRRIVHKGGSSSAGVVPPEHDPSLPFVEVRDGDNEPTFGTRRGNMAVVEPFPHDLFYIEGEGGTWKIGGEGGRRRAYSLSALDPEHLGQAHLNPLFQDDDDVTSSALALQSEMSMVGEDGGRRYSCVAVRRGEGEGEVGQFRHAKSLQNLFRHEPVTHFSSNDPSGQYTPSGKARRFMTKLALPRRKQRTRRLSASSADGADLKWDDESSVGASVSDVYSQVNKRGQGQKGGSHDYDDDSQEMFYLDQYYDDRPLNTDTEEEQMVSTDLDEESSSDESLKKEGREGRREGGGEGGRGGKVMDGKEKKAGSFLRKKRNSSRKTPGREDEKEKGRGKYDIQKTSAEVSRDGTSFAAATATTRSSAEYGNHKLKSEQGRETADSVHQPIDWDVNGEAQTSTMKGKESMTGMDFDGKGSADGNITRRKENPVGSTTRRSARLSSEEAQAIQALEREVLEPGEEGPPAYEERANEKTETKKTTNEKLGGVTTATNETLENSKEAKGGVVKNEKADDAQGNQKLTTKLEADLESAATSIARKASKSEENSLKSKFGIEDRKYVRLEQPLASAKDGGLMSGRPKSGTTEPLATAKPAGGALAVRPTRSASTGSSGVAKPVEKALTMEPPALAMALETSSRSSVDQSKVATQPLTMSPMPSADHSVTTKPVTTSPTSSVDHSNVTSKPFTMSTTPTATDPSVTTKPLTMSPIMPLNTDQSLGGKSSANTVTERPTVAAKPTATTLSSMSKSSNESSVAKTSSSGQALPIKQSGPTLSAMPATFSSGDAAAAKKKEQVHAGKEKSQDRTSTSKSTSQTSAANKEKSSSDKENENAFTEKPEPLKTKASSTSSTPSTTSTPMTSSAKKQPAPTTTTLSSSDQGSTATGKTPLATSTPKQEKSTKKASSALPPSDQNQGVPATGKTPLKASSTKKSSSTLPSSEHKQGVPLAGKTPLAASTPKQEKSTKKSSTTKEAHTKKEEPKDDKKARKLLKKKKTEDVGGYALKRGTGEMEEIERNGEMEEKRRGEKEKTKVMPSDFTSTLPLPDDVRLARSGESLGTGSDVNGRDEEFSEMSVYM